MASWGVVALVDEPAVLLAAQAAHHLAAGAAEVHLWLDRPDPEAADLLGAMAGVHLHHAGEDGWAFQGGGRRPNLHTARQKYIASKTLAETRLDWVMHCDADEFLTAPGGSVAEALAAAPAALDWVAVEVAERVQIGGRAGADIFAGAFRRPWRDFDTEGAGIFAPAACDYLHHGLAGHHNGKCCARAGRGLFIGVHHGLQSWAGARAVAQGSLPGLRLLHFDGLTELHYLLKILRRAQGVVPGAPSRHGAARLMQIAAVAGRAGDAQRLHRIWRLAKTLDRPQAAALEARGVLSHDAPGIAQSVAAQLGFCPDLSPAAFDRALIARERDLLESLRATFGFDPESLA